MLLAAAAASALLINLAGAFGGFRINMTPSEPLGLWRILPLDRDPVVGDMVFVCLPRSALVDEARAAVISVADFASGYAPLIKTVVAVAGQQVEIGQTVRIDGVGNPTFCPRTDVDGVGRPLISARDERIHSAHVFLHSPFPGSWDSRYFGSVPVSSVLGLARRC
jgi:conjugative transfer signal peptidase TraF